MLESEVYDLVREKTNNLSFRTGPTQTMLHNLRLEILDLERRGIALSV